MSFAGRCGALLGALTAAVLLGGCGSGSGARPTAASTANGVTVRVVLLPSSGGRGRIEATFSPQRAGFHLYSIDLPDGGVDGLGIPTRLAVRGGLAATGRPRADRPVRLLRPAGLHVALPVYPDGPVTFTLPVRRTGARVADVVVGYGACSPARCLIPVSGRVIRLALG